MERWEKVPHVFMPKHVAQDQQRSHSGPLTELFDDAVRAYVCGSPAAAFAMCRALLETVLKQSYLPGEFTETDKFGRTRDIPMGRLLELTRERHHSFPLAKIKPLVQISNAILHGKRAAALYSEIHILQFFKILKAVIENAPAPR
jgi:hypothetical protein